MTTTDLYENSQSTLERNQNDPSLAASPATNPSPQTKVTPIILNNGQLLEFQEKVFSIISENNGKLIFADLLNMMGEPYKQMLYKALMNLAKQQRIVRIRGIGKKRIEFYYYDIKKVRKQPASAAVSYVQI